MIEIDPKSARTLLDVLWSLPPTRQVANQIQRLEAAVKRFEDIREVVADKVERRLAGDGAPLHRGRDGGEPVQLFHALARIRRSDA